MDNIFEGKKIFVTGATGFIGSNLVRRLVKEGAGVFLLARENSNFWRLNDVLEKVKFKISDLSDFENIKRIIHNILPDGVFHLAASMMVGGKILEPEKVTKVNMDAVRNILEHIPKSSFFINTGTFSDGEIDKFNKSKFEGTAYCADFGRNNQRPIVTLRVFTPYGPYMQKGRFVSDVLVGMSKNENIRVGSPDVARDFIFVDDLVDLYFAAAEKAQENCGEVFDAGSGVSTTLDEAVITALRVTNSLSKIVWGNVPKLSYDAEKIQADTEKNEIRLLWKPKTMLDDGFQKTYDWLKENADKY